MKKFYLALVVCVMILFQLCPSYAQSITVETNVSAIALSDGINVEITFADLLEECSVITALFDGDKLVEVDVSEIDKTLKISFSKEVCGDRVQVFLWKNQTSMKPLTDKISVKVESLVDKFRGKKLYVDGDSICYGNGYVGGYGKIIADMYGMELVNSGVGGATISKCTTNTIKYGTQLDWGNIQYYLRLSGFDPIQNKNGDGFAVPITKDIYETGYGVYPTTYKVVKGELVQLEYSEIMPSGTFFVRFDVPTYDDNTVPKYYRMWNSNNWLWEAYKNGFKNAHECGDVKIGIARHWLCESVNKIDKDADFVIMEGGINEYLMDRPIGKLSDGDMEALDTTTTIGAMEYICRELVENHSDKKVIYLITPRASDYTDNIHPGYSTSKATWRDYHDAIVSVLEKYDIKYVDLFETEFDTAKEEYLQYTVNNDGVHPTKDGYEKFYIPYLEKAMAE